ncbi:dTDP-4-dehydrorhamnose 3,5-epimerase [Sediminicola luteus]|uniref:dTDP-4-dehydrorhamnose 3,5-epimerase n=1 Tax=Sediminicola luteus TaxID=319238 RepID=A0A2A4GDN4_9FLAO|nr:dTDP-4-dehydrorhamnose 3,5-epimerase [Sediminicola luteus]PCE66563.1 dTDP-4-dehydrorhamnose 3,5-epimerase [Sediminicola luteus]
MKVTETPLKGCFVIEPKVYKDERGYFIESFHEERFQIETGVDVRFVQDNQSYSKKGVIRALHYQEGEFAQAKLVRIIKGTVLDVAVDLRLRSKTYGEHFSVELSAENGKQLFIPRGFAHGFSVISEEAICLYKCDHYYNPNAEAGIRYNDPDLNIDWKLGHVTPIVSGRDAQLPFLKQLAHG